MSNIALGGMKKGEEEFACEIHIAYGCRSVLLSGLRSSEIDEDQYLPCLGKT